MYVYDGNLQGSWGGLPDLAYEFYESLIKGHDRMASWPAEYRVGTANVK